MIRIASILLLGLLLYHIFRAPLTLFLLEEFHLTASKTIEEDEWMVVKLPISLPYSNTWENSDNREGLIQHGDQFYNITEQRYENDTLYTTLKTNTSARETFLSIVEEINTLTDKQAENSGVKSPFSAIFKLLNQLSSIYLSSYFAASEVNLLDYFSKEHSFYLSIPISLLTYPVHTPPPETE